MKVKSSYKAVPKCETYATVGWGIPCFLVIQGSQQCHSSCPPGQRRAIPAAFGTLIIDELGTTPRLGRYASLRRTRDSGEEKTVVSPPTPVGEDATLLWNALVSRWRCFMNLLAARNAGYTASVDGVSLMWAM